MDLHLKSCTNTQDSPSTSAAIHTSNQNPIRVKTATTSPAPTAPSPQASTVVSSSAVSAAQSKSTTGLKKGKCPHCKLTFYKKNIEKHIQRTHNKKLKDITVHDHLKGVCVDATNGISAVQRARHGFSVPVHVQNKTWGHLHKVQCELEECRQYHLMAVRSGLTFRHCEHIRSLQYCRYS